MNSSVACMELEQTFDHPPLRSGNPHHRACSSRTGHRSHSLMHCGIVDIAVFGIYQNPVVSRTAKNFGDISAWHHLPCPIGHATGGPQSAEKVVCGLHTDILVGFFRQYDNILDVLRTIDSQGCNTSNPKAIDGMRIGTSDVSLT